jgi:penicillin amidase
LRHLLDTFETRGGAGAKGIDCFNVPGVPDAADRRDIVLLKSVKEALAQLASDTFKPAFNNSTNQADHRWGKLHRIVFAHPLGEPFSVPPAGGAFPPLLPGLAGIPTDGGYEHGRSA